MVSMDSEEVKHYRISAVGKWSNPMIYPEENVSRAAKGKHDIRQHPTHEPKQ